MSDDEITLPDVTVAPAIPTEAAYQRVLQEILTVTLADARMDGNVMAAVTTVLVALPGIRKQRARIAAEWRNFDFERFDKLDDYALALSHAHSLYRACRLSHGSTAEGARAPGPSTLAETAIIRQQAITLFTRAYDETRRAIVYLRAPYGDADTVAPPLPSGPPAKRAKPGAACRQCA